jgi:ketosteroid isomerase-like protein
MTHLSESPRAAFERMLDGWLSNDVEANADQLADDVVIEAPFAPPGRPQRIEGKEAFLAIARPARAALPFHLDESRLIAVHETADPEVIVVEYQLGGTVKATGERNRASFVGVLRVRAGKITHWREYQDTAAMARALGG